MADDDIDWVSSKEAARRLGITTRTLYRLIDTGELAAFKIGRVIRLRERDLEAFVESARVEPGSLSHLYPDPVRDDDAEDADEDNDA